jgi:hypothetical protein
MGVTKAAKDAFTLSDHLDHNNYLENLNSWENSRLSEGKFIVNRSRYLGKYLCSLTENDSLQMPNVIDVLKDTAISLNDINSNINNYGALNG